MRMRLVGIRWLVALAVSGSLLATPWGSAQAQEAQPSEAQLYFSNGVELLQQTPPNYQDAYNQFLLAYEKSNHNWKVLGNLGLCALNLERDDEAITYYRTYLDQGGQEVDPEERKSIEKELLLVQGNLAHVTFQSKEKGTKVTVRREGSSAPTRSYKLAEGPTKLGLRAGSYSFAADAGGKKVTWDVVIEPGQDLNHVFDFAPPPVAASQQEGGGLTTVQTTGLITGGVGVAALIGGVITGVMAKSKESSARDQCIDVAGTLTCPTSTQDEFDSASSLATVSTALFIGGGVLAATGVTLFIVGADSGGPKESGAPAARLQVTPYFGAGGGGLTALGTF
ncbi:MAG TPA: hypothetical protein VLC09_10475 [Polyangiaceae bacterium]|nr:hypothetical protein [Polyangiaceae bacterium]